MDVKLEQEGFQVIKTYIKKHPGLIELVDNVPYFIDKSITSLPLQFTLVITKLVRLRWSATESRAILSIDDNIASLIILAEETRLSDESCIALYNMGINLGHQSDDETGEKFYNKTEIMRKYTIDKIIKE